MIQKGIADIFEKAFSLHSFLETSTISIYADEGESTLLFDLIYHFIEIYGQSEVTVTYRAYKEGLKKSVGGIVASLFS